MMDQKLNGVFSGSVGANGADFYDPNQLLRTNDRPETSTAPLGLNSTKLHEPESFLEGSPSDHHHGFGND